MMNMGFFICTKCNKQFEKELGLLRHLNHSHSINVVQYVLETKYNNVYPTCKCGCGEQTKYGPELKDFREFIPGHQSRVSNNYQTEKSIANSKATRAKQKLSGELKGIDSEETKKKRSESHSGKKNHMYGKHHSKNTLELISQRQKERFENDPEAKKANGDRSREYWSKEENRIKQSMRQTQYLLDNNLFKPSGLEEKFAKLLKELNVEFEQQYRIKDGKTNGVYDFKIKDKNILIEVDGDFWHCNPRLYPTPIHKVQLRNMENDSKKNELAKRTNHQLIRFWQNDIEQNIEEVKTQLNQILNDSNKSNNN